MQQACDLCSGNKHGLLFSKNGYRIVRCKECKLVYVNDIPKQSILNKKYNNNELSPYFYYIDNKSEDYASFRQRIDIIEQYVPDRGTMLDLGCAIGTFMKAAQDKGWTVYGLDVNHNSVAYARKTGLDVKEGCLEHDSFTKESFDVVVMNDFLEHTVSPKTSVTIATGFLKKNGVLYIVTPNIGSIVPKTFGKRWLHLKPEEHLYYFTAETITKLLDTCGLQIMSIKSRGRIRTANILAKKIDTYSKILSNALCALPDNILKKIKLNLNVGDEMEVIARK